MRYLLCWLGATDINLLNPVCDINQIIKLANQGDSTCLANLVRLNWMVQDLKFNPMIKPVFCRDDTLDVIVGDTRIMAAKLAGLSKVPVMAYLQTPQGTVCHDIDDLKTLSGFAQDAEIVWAPPNTDILHDPPAWIDIGDYRTRHHGHDEVSRLQAMTNHIKNDPRPLTVEWIMEPRDWGDIFS